MSKLIAIDDGHGMQTAGKRTPIFPSGSGMKSETGNFMHENEFNRAVAKYLNEELKRCGFRILMVAPTDADTPLETRVASANRDRADLYLSIHANANTAQWGSWGGTETFTSGRGESLRIGKTLHKYLMVATKLRDRGVKNGSHLYVIRNTIMPSVLLEVAFMDNLTEAKMLLQDSFRRNVATNIAMGVCESFGVRYIGVAKPTSTQPVVKPVQSPTITSLYRVRKTWADAKSQIGAFADLNGAKELADKNSKEGYKVFDQNGKEVYSTKVETVVNKFYRVRKDWSKPETQVGAFSNLDNAKELADEKATDGVRVFDDNGKVVYTPVVKKPNPLIETQPQNPTPVVKDEHEGHHNIMGESIVSKEKMSSFARSKNAMVENIDEISECFIEVGKKYGVRGDIAFCQSLIETGWFKFDGGTAVTADQHNYCGMGVTSKGMKGNSFVTAYDGVTAQIQHLYAYASKTAIPSNDEILDPRFKYVTRGVAPHWEDLSNRWAMNANYGKHILSMYEQLTNFIEPVKPEVIELEVIEPEVVKPDDVVEIEVVESINEKDDANSFKKVVDYFFEKLSEFFGKK